MWCYRLVNGLEAYEVLCIYDNNEVKTVRRPYLDLYNLYWVEE